MKSLFNLFHVFVPDFPVYREGQDQNAFKFFPFCNIEHL
jgi:hypothetical protein